MSEGTVTAPAPQWVLRGTLPSGEALAFRLLPGGPRTVGRAVRADFIVDAPLVSRRVAAESAVVVDELAKWGKVVRAAGVTIN